jgi:hypothetical protein
MAMLLHLYGQPPRYLRLPRPPLVLAYRFRLKLVAPHLFFNDRGIFFGCEKFI